MMVAATTASRVCDLLTEHGLADADRFLRAYAEVHVSLDAPATPVAEGAVSAPVARPAAAAPTPGPGGRHKAERRRPARTPVVPRPTLHAPAPRPVVTASWAGNALVASATAR